MIDVARIRPVGRIFPFGGHHWLAVVIVICLVILLVWVARRR